MSDERTTNERRLLKILEPLVEEPARVACELNAFGVQAPRRWNAAAKGVIADWRSNSGY